MITCERGHFRLDGEPLFLYSGEIHYFRLAPRLWAAHLDAARAAGLNAVSSYIPWIWHEPEEGRFDFSGRTHPQRHLERYLALVRERGLRFIARIGPVANAELANEGLPHWLVREHPEIVALGREITNLPHTTLLAYHSPTFQERVSRWYDAVLPVVSRHAHPRGPVVLVQLCNEIGMVQWLQKAADRTSEAEAMYRDFLRRLFGDDIERLNQAYGTRHRGFAELAQPESGEDRQNPRLLLDWMRFYQDYFARYFGGLHRRYAARGLELPVLANIPQFYDFDVRGRGVFSPMTATMFRDFPARVPGVVFGGAYQIRRLDFENFHDLAITTEVLEMIGGRETPAMCAELQTGIMRDRPRLYPQDVELNLKTSAAHGLNALNAYMFSGGCNPSGLGAFGAYHDWQAPVAADGRRRPHFRALRDFGRQVRAFGPRLAETRKQVDLVVGFYAPYWTTEYLSGPAIEELEWKKHHLFFDGLGRLLHLAHLNFSLVDLERATLEELRRLPAMAIFSLDFMDAETQAKLVAYARSGGRLLLNPELPMRDVGGEPCTVLADFLQAKPAGRLSGTPVYHLGELESVSPGGLTWFEASGAEIVARTAEGKPCALEVRRGDGQVLLCGCGLNHMFDYQVALVGALAGRLGIRPAIQTDPDLHVCLRATADYGFLLVANYHDAPRAGRIHMKLPGEARAVVFPARGKLTLAARRAYLLPLRLPLANGDRLRYASVEVLDVRARGREVRLLVAGAAGAVGEVELITRARAGSLDGRRIAAQRLGARLRLRFTASGAPQRLVVR